MSKNPRKLLGLWAVLVALAFPAACGSSGVVGGQCSASHVDCNGQCVDAQNDPNNCGGCGRKCKPGVSCEDALCEGVPAGNGGASKPDGVNTPASEGESQGGPYPNPHTGREEGEFDGGQTHKDYEGSENPNATTDSDR